MNIIVRKQPTHSIFRSHWNSSMQKYYYTKQDYLGDIKKHNLEPYREVPKSEPKPMRLTRDQREMCYEAAKHDRNKTTPGSRFQDAFKSLNVAKKPKWLTDAECLTGGFKDE